MSSTLEPAEGAGEDGAQAPFSTASFPLAESPADDRRYVAWFHELDAWTEYWDIYHPESKGRFYFGNGGDEAGLLGKLLPRTSYPPPWTAWSRWALKSGSAADFVEKIRAPDVSAAVMEVDDLVTRLFVKHFGDARDPAVQADYLEATFRFALDVLPPATERAARIPEGDWRKPTAGRHTLDGDLMWFAWTMHTEAAQAIAGGPRDPRRTLTLAGVAVGCPTNFAWRGHRRTRSEYRPGAETALLLRKRGLAWARDYDAAAEEIHALYQVREWGESI